ncbi:MAG TPA: methylenetetrahydrofolate reductase [Xanthobacteraceae bacterium]|nr:methylenetetrahydrofolate reductase [Xanthobacteraceae bacterium]
MMSPPVETPVPAPGHEALDPVARIAAFARTASFETTHLTDQQIAEVVAAARPGSTVYIAAIPSRPLSEQIDTAASMHKAGFEPVPHLAVRNFHSVEEMETHLRRLMDEAGAVRALVIAGDRPDPAGSLFDALAAIRSGVLQRHGLKEIGISGYPDGHSRISDAQLAQALTDKLAAAKDAGLKVRIVTQFTMSTQPILDLVTGLRARGIDNPVSVGLAGPASMATLLRFAKICGVKTSVQGLARNAGLLKNLIGAATADPIVRALSATEGLGDINPHFFSFGGLPATARWVAAAASGRIKLNKDGFEILQSK